jgi:hypothetical protein
MPQNNLTFIATYNSKDPPKLLFKHCADCQEIAIVAQVLYMVEQLLMNIVDLFTHAGIDMDNWECKLDADKTYVNLHPFIRATYQRCLASGVITATQSGYASNNCFAGLTTADNVSDDGTADTIVKSIQTHMANLSATVILQLTTSNNVNTAVFNASMQQVAVNKAQRNTNHMHMLKQFPMMTTNQPGSSSLQARSQANQLQGLRLQLNATSSPKPSLCYPQLNNGVNPVEEAVLVVTAPAMDVDVSTHVILCSQEHWSPL